MFDHHFQVYLVKNILKCSDHFTEKMPSEVEAMQSEKKCLILDNFFYEVVPLMISDLLPWFSQALFLKSSFPCKES